MRRNNANPDIIKKAAEKAVFYWQIAEKLDICEVTFSRWMRRPMDDATKSRALHAIEEIAMRGNR